MSNFNNFIEGTELVDISVIGGVFTWFSGPGKAMRILDKFLFSDNVISRWRTLGQHTRKRDFRPLPDLDMASLGDWGLKPSRFNNCWVNHKDFLSFVKEEWNSMSVKGQGDYILKEKLKALKGRLKWWNKYVFG